MNKKQREEIKRRMVVELENCPIIFAVCKKLKINRATYYRWLKEDKVFSSVCDISLCQGRENINDLAESKLISKINDSDMKAVTFWLEVNSPRYAHSRNNKNEFNYNEKEILDQNRKLLKELGEVTKELVLLENKLNGKNNNPFD